MNWEYSPWMPEGDEVRLPDEWIPGIINGFGQPVQLIPIARYRYTEMRWKYRITVLPDGRKWAEREPEYRTVRA